MTDPLRKRRPIVVSDIHPTRERLTRAGVHYFQSEGYHGTGINEILARAKAPKGSFYHHFPGGKEELAVAALSWLQGKVTRFLDGLAISGASSDAMVVSIARYAAEGIRKGGRARGSLLAVLAQDAAPDSLLVAAATKEYLNVIRARIANARAKEHPQDDAIGFADQAMAMIQGAGVLARAEGKPDRAVEIVVAWLRSK